MFKFVSLSQNVRRIFRSRWAHKHIQVFMKRRLLKLFVFNNKFKVVQQIIAELQDLKSLFDLLSKFFKYMYI